MATAPISRAPAAAGWRGPAPELLAEADLVAPVPLHWRRLLMRRYNQAVLLARSVARQAPGKLAPDLLRRHRWTGSQAGLKAKERRSNVRQAFAVHPRWAQALEGKSVLLIDDVLTTGATVVVALGIGEIHAIGFCGDDGEGYELRQALKRAPE